MSGERNTIYKSETGLAMCPACEERGAAHLQIRQARVSDQSRKEVERAHESSLAEAISDA
jgi:hypothetical protein